MKDTGIGIDEVKLQDLFQPFSQLDASTSRQYGGTGLGLAICKKLVEMMGGEISARSDPGHGSEFSFTAEFNSIGAATWREPPESSHSLRDIRNLQVLVIDDSHNSREILKDLLQDLGVRPVMASSGAEGLQLMSRADGQKPFNVVLIDWKMPELDGIEVGTRHSCDAPGQSHAADGTDHGLRRRGVGTASDRGGLFPATSTSPSAQALSSKR